MGRYTTVKTFSDQDANNAAISYASETASTNIDVSITNTSGESVHNASNKEDKFQVNRVENVSGSSAGAGSGDFHMYRASRRRELERIEKLEKEHQQKKEKEEFEAKRKHTAEEFEAKAKKRADQRKRRKENAKAKALDDRYQDDNEKDADVEKKNNNKIKSPQQAKQSLPETPGGVPAIPNDGSFLERMLALQAKKEINK